MVVGEVSERTELAVVGGGPGGYVAAIRAGQLGLDVTLVDSDGLGGVCLNDGCIPSKALITAADVAHDAATAEAMGVHADPSVDLEEMMSWKDDVVDRLTGGVGKLCKANGVTVVEGTAAFEGDHALRVAHEGEGRGAETLQFDEAVVATGSRAVELPPFPFDADPVWDASDALDAETFPDELAVVGGGYIGMELATVYAKLGSDVTVLELLDSVLPQYDDDLTRPVRKRAEELGVDVRTGVSAEGYEETDDGVAVTLADADPVPADRILVAVGREPRTESANLDAAGVETDDDGFVPTDEECRTNVDHIYAVGDVAGEPMLAHKASAEGEVAAGVAAGEPAAFDNRAVPAAVFTDPEIATVGLTESEAAEAGYDPVVGQFPFRASGRALTVGDAEGFVRVVADESGTVLGGQVVGPEASELIAEITLAVEMGATLEDVAGTVHTHPTLAEAVMEAAENAMGRAIHTLNR